MSPQDTTLQAELEERLRFETLIADLSSRFINLPAGEGDREIMDERGCPRALVPAAGEGELAPTRGWLGPVTEGSQPARGSARSWPCRT
jgi:hypothetical protein